MKRELSNGPAGTFFQIVNIGDVIGLKIFMSHLMTFVIYKYLNVFKILFYLSTIILTVVIFMTVIRIVICVESTRVFQYK